jgi:hypothetical protein
VSVSRLMSWNVEELVDVNEDRPGWPAPGRSEGADAAPVVAAFDF